MSTVKKENFIKIGSVSISKKNGICDFMLELSSALVGVYFLCWTKDHFKKKETTAKMKEEEEEIKKNPEKQAKQEDAEVKSRVSKTLRLFDAASPKSSFIGDGERTSVNYLVEPIIKLGDRIVIASPPGHGKSILATQIGISIAKGVVPEFLESTNTAPHQPQTVFLYDAELDDDDISNRYGGMGIVKNLYRLTGCKYRTLYYLLDDIYNRVMEAGDDLTVILDNIYALMPRLYGEETRTFLDGLDSIQRITRESGRFLTFIIVTHTVKGVNGVAETKDVAGSANFSRFAKSVLTLGREEDDVTILTTGKKRYDKDCDYYTMKLVDMPYLHFEPSDSDSNKKVGRVANKSKYDIEIKKRIFNMHIGEERGYSYRAIAEKLSNEVDSISHTTVKKYFKEQLGLVNKYIQDMKNQDNPPSFREIQERLAEQGYNLDIEKIEKIEQLYKQLFEEEGNEPKQ